MIEKKSYEDFTKKLYEDTQSVYPISTQIDLTYRCNLKCIHCYCRGSEWGKELNTQEWKHILDQVHAAGTVWLTLTGGEPSLRDDFWEIYIYAKKKGFLISFFTDGVLLDDDSIELLAKFPPYSIEITLHGVTEGTYESISQVKGSFKKVMNVIDKIVARNLPLVLKAVGLKENRDEIHAIKAYAEKLLGNKKFKFDSFITPLLNGDRTPCMHRLSPKEIQEIEESDPDMQDQRQKGFEKHKSHLRDKNIKYHCNSWFRQSYIDPYGMMKFCLITDKYSIDLKKESYLKGFYERVPAILEEKYTSNFECLECDLREFCHHCPPRAFLETGKEDAPVPYYCELARLRKERIEKTQGREHSKAEK